MLHMLWAGLLLFSDSPKDVTAIYALSKLYPNRFGLAIILIAVASCATYALLRHSGSVGSRVVLLLPQQILLAISAVGAVRAMALGHYADGVARSHVFLIADQSPAVLALVIHSATILYLALLYKWLANSAVS